MSGRADELIEAYAVSDAVENTLNPGPELNARVAPVLAPWVLALLLEMN